MYKDMFVFGRKEGHAEERVEVYRALTMEKLFPIDYLFYIL